jgi:hypothetical protein
MSQEDYYALFTAYPEHDYSFPADYEAAEYILDTTDEEDAIFILGGIESVIHFLTKRPSPSRFIFSFILFSDTHGRGPKGESYRSEVLEDLRATPPKYILAVPSLEAFSEFTDIHGFIARNYILDRIFADDRHLYRYRGSEGKDA